MRKGEVWLVNFSPSVGDEITKARPAIIVSNDDMGGLQLRIVVPVTNAKKPARPWHVKLEPSGTNNLMDVSLADCFQVKCFARERFHKKIGVISPKDMDEIKLCISHVLDLV